MSLSVISPIELDGKDISLLSAALAFDYSGIDIVDVCELSLKNRAQIWKFYARDSRAVLVTQINVLQSGSELYVRYLAGENLRPHYEAIHDVLLRFARTMNCNRISADTRPGMARILTRGFGFKEKTRRVTKEVSDG